MAPRESRLVSSSFGLLSGAASARMREQLRPAKTTKSPTAKDEARAKEQVRQAVAERAAKAAAKQAAQKTFVDLVLLDEDDKPVAGARYRVKDVGGNTFEGSTDGSGAAHVEGLVPGPCAVGFPDYDGGDWWRDEDGPAQPAPKVAEKDFLELAVADEDGVPAAGLAFVVTDANGTRHGGTLDAKGAARLEGVAKGRVRVVFPDLDASDWDD